jgi:peptide/nickel transport system permease protein
MLAQGRGLLNIAPHVASLPGLAILLVSLGLNLFGDALRDALDPRSPGGF